MNILLNQQFDLWFERAKVFESEFFSKPNRESCRGSNFFPKEYSHLGMWMKTLQYCCGVVELTATNLPHSWCDGYRLAQRDGALLLHDLQKMVLAWVLGTYEDVMREDDDPWWGDDEDGEPFEHTGAGLIIYPYPTDSSEYSEFAAMLIDFGFQSLVSFPNPMHQGHQLNLLACSTYEATKAIQQGEISWLDASAMKPAQSVAPATM